jgi:GTP-binding protein HflX
MRAIRLPSGRTVILSDTVGFISELPTQLVEAFRATLEEVAAADIILHVRDAAHPDSAAQRNDVLEVLAEMAEGPGAPLDAGWQDRVVEVLNKADLMGGVDAVPHLVGTIAVSALTGDGLERLRAALDERLAAGMETIELRLAPSDGAGIAWLYEHGEVLAREDGEREIRLRVRLSPADRARFEQRS